MFDPLEIVSMKKILLLSSFFLFLAGVHAQKAEWQTIYETSGYLETPSYEATIDYCRQLDASSPMITYTTFGKSARGKALPLLILDRDGFTQPEEIRRAGRTLLLLQACIHAGESDGKDAGLMLFRDLTIGSPQPGNAGTGGSKPREVKHLIKPSSELLENVSIIFIPIFNVDGHERFGPYNRINQNGPREMGWRTTANNLNLNRDYLKAEAPEMQAWLTMFNRWMPDFFVDAHTTDGADYQYVLTYLMEIYGDMDEGLTNWSKNTFIPRMQTHMNNSGYPVYPYVGFRNWHDPRSGLITHVAPPMLSQGYTSLRNRPGLLIETHMLKPYRQRVESTYECILTTLEILGKESVSLRRLIQTADQFTQSDSFLKEPFPLEFETRKDDSLMVEFLGVEYEMVKSDITGGNWFKYSDKPAAFQLPYFSSTRPVLTVKLPRAYVIPPEWKTIIDRIRIHGIKTWELSKDVMLAVATYRFKNPKWQQFSFEGRHPMTNIEYDEIVDTCLFPAGSAVVEVMQPAGYIIPHLLEPKGSGSFVYWGFFDAIFEQKEYGESYVIEKMAREMMAEDPALIAEFEEKKRTDSTFALSPQQILNWFYNKTPYADKRKGIYPVGKIYDPKVLESLKH